MALKVVGAGLGRTGTKSLKTALEILLDGPCHHMYEVIEHPESYHYWEEAAAGDLPDWEEVFAGYVASVDWPSAAYWQQISAVYPDAMVLLSTRASAEDWYRSAIATIFDFVAPGPPGSPIRIAAVGFPRDPEGAMAAYEAHNQHVRDTVPPDRLVEWQPGDGWGPLCAGLGLAMPTAPFPHENTTAEFQERVRQMREAEAAGTP